MSDPTYQQRMEVNFLMPEIDNDAEEVLLRLVCERDACMEALKAIVQYAEEIGDYVVRAELIDKARAAIARCEKGQS